MSIGEPFQLYLGSTHSRMIHSYEAVYAAHSNDVPGYATITAQKDGIHIWDLQNLHAVASHLVSEQVYFAGPAITIQIADGGDTSVVSYVPVFSDPDYRKGGYGSIVWIVQQNLSGSKPTEFRKIIRVADSTARMYGTGHAAVPLLLVSQNGSLSIADAQMEIKNELDWPGEQEHLETFVFLRESCHFLQDDSHSYTSIAVTCCQTITTVYARVVLLGDEITLAGTCEMPILDKRGDAKSVLGVTCSSTGILSFLDYGGRWGIYQLTCQDSSLVTTPISKDLQVHRFTAVNSRHSSRKCLSAVSLGTGIVMLAAFVNDTQDIFFQLWDLTYGVLLSTQRMPAPVTFPVANLKLTVADKGQVLLTVTPNEPTTKSIPKRSLIYVVPVDAQLKSSLAAALGKSASTAKWLITPHEVDSGIIVSVQHHLKNNNTQKAERVFLAWVDSHSSKEAAFPFEFVKKMLNFVLPLEPSPYAYTPRIVRCILENTVVSTISLDGRLITLLRERDDWENIMFALTTVEDISEDELMAAAKFLIDKHRSTENAMDVDISDNYVPPFWRYLFACVSYAFSAAPMRLAIRKHLHDARDLVVILSVLEDWMQRGNGHEVEEALLKSVTMNTQLPSSGADSPPYPKVIAFLQALLDASFVALLQYQPSHDILRRILSYIEPEINLIGGMEPLRGMLEPFAKAQMLKEKADPSLETPAEWRKRRKWLGEQASLSVGLYRLEELAI